MIVIVQGYSGLARLLGISKQALAQYVKKGMPSKQIGLHVYFNSSKIENWLKEQSPRHAGLAQQLADKVKELCDKCG